MAIYQNLVSFEQLLVGLATFLTLRLVLFFYNRHKIHQIFKLSAIPGPRSNLIDGNMRDWLRDRTHLHVMREWREKYGKVFGFYLGYLPVLVISDRKILRKFLLENQNDFIDRAPPFIEIQPLLSSILFVKGNKWRSMRKTLAPAFSSFHFKGEAATKFIDESVNLMSKYLQDKHEKSTSGGGQPMLVDIHSLMKATTLHLISSMALDFKGVQIREHDAYVERLDKFLERCDDPISHWAARLPILKTILSFIGSHVTVGKIQEDILIQLRAKIAQLKNCNTNESHNILERMVQLNKDGMLTERQILGNCMAFLLAGYDTTATTLAYFFYAMAKHQDIQEKLRLDIITNGCDESKYLKMVLNETMRLYPAVVQFTQREASKDITIDKLTIKKGVIVMVNSWLIHNEPDNWPEPDRFDPERFADMTKIDPFAFTPFGVTQRFCLGAQLAQLELRIIATELLMQYKFTLVKPNNLIMATSAQVLTKPTETIILKLEKI